MSSSDTRDIQYEKHLDKLAYSWNSKKSGNNIELSSLNTFTRLYLLLKDGEQNLKNSLSAAGAEILTLKSDDTALNDKKIVDISTYITQINANDKYNSGGIGINSLKVERSNREAFTIRYDMSLTITNSKIIDERLDISKVIQLSSDWIIAYGWDGFREINRSRGQNSEPEVITPSVPSIDGSRITYNNSDKNNGYWDWNYVKLYKFNFNITNEGHLQGSLQFSNADSLNISSTRIHEISTQVLNDLKKPSSETELITNISTIGLIPGYEELLLTYPQNGKNWSSQAELSNVGAPTNDFEKVYGFFNTESFESKESYNLIGGTSATFDKWNNDFTIDPNYDTNDESNPKTYVFGNTRQFILNADGTVFDTENAIKNSVINNIYDYNLEEGRLGNQDNVYFLIEYSDLTRNFTTLQDFDNYIENEVDEANRIIGDGVSNEDAKNTKLFLSETLIQIPQQNEEINSVIPKGYSKPYMYIKDLDRPIQKNNQSDKPNREYLGRLFTGNNDGIKLPIIKKLLVKKDFLKTISPNSSIKLKFNNREIFNALKRPNPPFALNQNGEPLIVNDNVKSGYYLYDLQVDLKDTKIVATDELSYFYNKKTSDVLYIFNNQLLQGNFDNIIKGYYKYIYNDLKPYNNLNYKPFFNELTVETVVNNGENESQNVDLKIEASPAVINSRGVSEKLYYFKPEYISARQYSVFLKSYKQKIKYGVDFLSDRITDEENFKNINKNTLFEGLSESELDGYIDEIISRGVAVYLTAPEEYSSGVSVSNKEALQNTRYSLPPFNLIKKYAEKNPNYISTFRNLQADGLMPNGEVDIELGVRVPLGWVKNLEGDLNLLSNELRNDIRLVSNKEGLRYSKFEADRGNSGGRRDYLIDPGINALIREYETEYTRGTIRQSYVKQPGTRKTTGRVFYPKLYYSNNEQISTPGNYNNIIFMFDTTKDPFSKRSDDDTFYRDYNTYSFIVFNEERGDISDMLSNYKYSDNYSFRIGSSVNSGGGRQGFDVNNILTLSYNKGDNINKNYYKYKIRKFPDLRAEVDRAESTSKYRKYFNDEFKKSVNEIKPEADWLRYNNGNVIIYNSLMKKYLDYQAEYVGLSQNKPIDNSEIQPSIIIFPSQFLNNKKVKENESQMIRLSSQAFLDFWEREDKDIYEYYKDNFYNDLQETSVSSRSNSDFFQGLSQEQSEIRASILGFVIPEETTEEPETSTSDTDQSDSTEGGDENGDGEEVTSADEISIEVEGYVNNNNEEYPVAYFLGAVLESIAKNVNARSSGQEFEKKKKMYFKYSKLPAVVRRDISKLARSQNLYVFGDSNKTRSVSYGNLAKTTFDILVDYETIDRLLNDPNIHNKSVIYLLKNVLNAINIGPLSGLQGRLQLGYRKIMEGELDVIELYVESRKTGGVNEQLKESYKFDKILNISNGTEDAYKKAIVLNHGDSQSLVESFNVSSKIDPLAYSTFQIPLRAGLGSLNLQDLLTSTVEGNQSNSLKTYLRESLEDTFQGKGIFFKSLISNSNANDFEKRLRNIINVLDGGNPDRITQTVFDDLNKMIFSDPTGKAIDLFLYDSFQRDPENNTLSDLLLNFLFNVDATIHGTTGIYLLDPIIINDFVNAAEGIYVVNSVVESLTPNSFNTVLNLKLYSPIENLDTPLSLNEMVEVTARDDISGASLEGYLPRNFNIEEANRLGYIYVIDNFGNFVRKTGVYNIAFREPPIIRDQKQFELKERLLSDEVTELPDGTLIITPDGSLPDNEGTIVLTPEEYADVVARSEEKFDANGQLNQDYIHNKAGSPNIIVVPRVRRPSQTEEEKRGSWMGYSSIVRRQRSNTDNDTGTGTSTKAGDKGVVL